MADIFISYSKSERPLAAKLASFFEAEGWTVWVGRRVSALLICGRWAAGMGLG
jgi:hypothetical protein